MKPDGGDIRFSIDDRGLVILDHGVVLDIDTTSTMIFVKIPSIPAGTNVSIYMFFGNPSATTPSTTITSNISKFVTIILVCQFHTRGGSFWFLLCFCLVGLV